MGSLPQAGVCSQRASLPSPQQMRGQGPHAELQEPPWVTRRPQQVCVLDAFLP